MKKKPMVAARQPAKHGNPVRRPGRGAAKTSAKTSAKAPGGLEAEADRQTIRRLTAQLAHALQQIEDLKACADTDFLLDIFNRRGFCRELNRSFAYIKRYHATAALIVLDVDRLKPINDAFGHAAGDQVLKAVARTLTEHVRSSDLVGRLGGDEFGVLLWHLEEADARIKAAALERAIDSLRFTFDDHVVRAGASAGVAILDGEADPNRALEEADRAMYVRKAQRRGVGVP